MALENLHKTVTKKWSGYTRVLVTKYAMNAFQGDKDKTTLAVHL